MSDRMRDPSKATDRREYGPMPQRPKDGQLRYPSRLPSISQTTVREVEQREDGWYVVWTTTYA